MGLTDSVTVLLLPVSFNDRVFGTRLSSGCFRELLLSDLLPFVLGKRMVSLVSWMTELLRDFGRSTTTPQGHTFSLGILEKFRWHFKEFILTK